MAKYFLQIGLIGLAAYAGVWFYLMIGAKILL